MAALLDVEDLRVTFPAADGDPLVAVDRIGLRVDAGQVLGVVGESGSGKSLTALALMGLLDPAARCSATALRFDGRDLRALRARERRRLLGADIAMIFQDPIASLNPCFTVGWQLQEALRLHGQASRARALELLERVGIADPARRLKAWPHQLSGGTCQRVMIAIALACQPRLLIADEPTTALDVTIQAQIMRLLAELQRASGMTMLLISHDLALVAQSAQRLLVMYCGQVVESGATEAVLTRPRHPYTAALLAASPERAAPGQPLQALPGSVPGLRAKPSGCLFHPRCPRVQPRCRVEAPQLDAAAQAVRCFFPLETR